MCELRAWPPNTRRAKRSGSKHICKGLKEGLHHLHLAASHAPSQNSGSIAAFPLTNYIKPRQNN